jgi:transposase
VVEQLDLSGLEESYAGRGSDAHHPATPVALLLYGYATGIFSSRALARASYDSIAVRPLLSPVRAEPDVRLPAIEGIIGRTMTVFKARRP